MGSDPPEGHRTGRAGSGSQSRSASTAGPGFSPAWAAHWALPCSAGREGSSEIRTSDLRLRNHEMIDQCRARAQRSPQYSSLIESPRSDTDARSALPLYRMAEDCKELNLGPLN